jgi:hypothetical protein
MGAARQDANATESEPSETRMSDHFPAPDLTLVLRAGEGFIS